MTAAMKSPSIAAAGGAGLIKKGEYLLKEYLQKASETGLLKRFTPEEFITITSGAVLSYHYCKKTILKVINQKWLAPELRLEGLTDLTDTIHHLLFTYQSSTPHQYAFIANKYVKLTVGTDKFLYLPEEFRKALETKVVYFLTAGAQKAEKKAKKTYEEMIEFGADDVDLLKLEFDKNTSAFYIAY